MTRAATSLFAFALYLFGLGAVLLIAPNVLLGLFGIAPTTETWIRVIGMLVVILGYYYLNVARAGLEPFLRWTVHARFSVVLFFTAFVAMGLAPPQLILFGVVDAGGALWTLLALRADAAAGALRR